ncbi:MAG TPA: glycosyltransferase, partial [Microbacteriaceae bacterium]|nr:glycosyltransferase [Microbacteriaceae bacterium]
MSVVTAIVVVRNGERELPATLEALAAQSRRPDALVIIDCASRDSSPEIARAVGPTDFVRVEHRLSFGDAVATVARSLPAPAPGDAYWLLPHDAAPEPGALAALLAELETSPSVGVVGPKLVRADNPDYVVEFGLTTSRFGTTVAIVHDELDQGQHDDMSDVLAVAPAGMLVRS